jgi:hypothetical protein
MKVFISISINDLTEGFIFGHKLRNKNFEVIGNRDWENKELDFFAKRKIQRANLFIGYITSNKDIESVVNEWQYAQSEGILNLLLVEDVVPLSNNLEGNIIIFNRKKSQKAIREIKKRMKLIESSKMLSRVAILAWTLGSEVLIELLEGLMIPAQEALAA